jgi:hypothetical protein
MFRHRLGLKPKGRIAAVLVAAPALALGGLALTAPYAHAASVDVTCVGTETVSYQPGLLLTSRQVSVAVTGILAPCTSSDAGVTSGNYVENFMATLSCSTLLSGRTGTRVFHWSNGRTSTFNFNRALNNVGGQTTVTFTGDIVSGEFAGDTVLEQVVFVTPSVLQCLVSPGLTSLGPGPIVLSISKL